MHNWVDPPREPIRQGPEQLHTYLQVPTPEYRAIALQSGLSLNLSITIFLSVCLCLSVSLRSSH